LRPASGRDSQKLSGIPLRGALPSCMGGPMRRSAIALSAALTLAGAAPASAQPATLPATPPAPPAQLPVPAPLVQNDEMLEPVAPPPNIVATWDDALAALRARSTELRIALDEIEVSEGNWRAALAGSLPTLTGTGNVTKNLLPGTPAPTCV